MLCSRRMLCCQKMLSGDALLFKDALGGCSLGDALFSEDWEKRAAEDALAHTGRAPWLTEVSHLASAHKHPRKVPWMEEGNLRGPHGGSDGKEDPKECFATGNRGRSQGDASFVKSRGESRAVPRQIRPRACSPQSDQPGGRSGPPAVTHRPGPGLGRAVPVALTRAAVELAGLGDVPFAQTRPLADGGPDPVHVIFGQDGVEEDAPGARAGRG